MENLISRLRKSNIGINVVDDKLKLSLPGDFNCPEIIDEIKIHKQAIISFLKMAKLHGNPDVGETWGNKADIKKAFYPEKRSFYDAAHQLKKEFIRFQLVGPYAFNVNFHILFQSFDKNIMERVLLTIIDRHESLRTYMVVEDGYVKQKIFDVLPEGFSIGYINVTGVEEGSYKQSLLYSQASDVLFDFKTQPLIAFNIVEYDAKLRGVFVSMHHAISDETSIRILKNEIALLYAAFSKGAPNPLLPNIVQYKDYANWVDNFLNSNKGKCYRDRYLTLIKESLLINGEYGGNSEQEAVAARQAAPKSYRQQLEAELKKFTANENIDHLFEVFGTLVNIYVPPGATYKTFIGAPLLMQLKKLSVNAGSSLFMTLTTAFAILFNKMEGKKSVRMCLPYSTRVFKEFESIIGWLASEIIICLNVNPEMSVKELIGVVTDRIIETADFRFYPHEQLLQDLDIRLDLLSPVYLNFISTPELTIEQQLSAHKDSGSGHFNFNCRMVEYSNCIALICQYRSDVYTPERIEYYFNSFFKILEAIVEYSGSPIGSFIDSTWPK